MKKLLTYLFMVVLLAFAAAVSAAEESAAFKNSKAMDDAFVKLNAAGTLVIYNAGSGEYFAHDSERAMQRFYPASTFKIFNSLIGLEVCAVPNVDAYFYKYTGEKVFLESWQNDANLREAIKRSQVPAYKLLARKIGRAAMQANINKLGYGNMEIGDASHIDSFWLEGPLKISAYEQVRLLNKLASGKLPFSAKAISQTIDICRQEKTADYTLYGKTGWATDNIVQPVGWYVGWVDSSKGRYVFAVNLDINSGAELYKREAVVREVLAAMDVLK